MLLLDSPRIIGTLERLKTHRPAVFGGEAHGFRLNPRLTEADVQGFERDHRVALPPDYRQFLTDVGNGGAGPFYGVFPLGQMDDGWGFGEWKENDGFVGVVSQPFLLETTWNDLSCMPNPELSNRKQSEYEGQMELFEQTYWSATLMNGAIPICHEGCAMRIWLVVTGGQAGTLWEDKRSEYAGLHRIRLADGSPATFARWYEKWLDQCVAISDGVYTPQKP
jgi:hypothetical protein